MVYSLVAVVAVTVDWGGFDLVVVVAVTVDWVGFCLVVVVALTVDWDGLLFGCSSDCKSGLGWSLFWLY
jgi:hypothetical protein